jgi:hypothetical protein
LFKGESVALTVIFIFSSIQSIHLRCSLINDVLLILRQTYPIKARKDGTSKNSARRYLKTVNLMESKKTSPKKHLGQI